MGWWRGFKPFFFLSIPRFSFFPPLPIQTIVKKQADHYSGGEREMD